ncbi:hypothetical protein HZC31_02575 [Candidatus Woesearchaeota archaeon]|nr:hypothetical protein [Candidatus Woesearchaeota archaeon]
MGPLYTVKLPTEVISRGTGQPIARADALVYDLMPRILGYRFLIVDELREAVHVYDDPKGGSFLALSEIHRRVAQEEYQRGNTTAALEAYKRMLYQSEIAFGEAMEQVQDTLLITEKTIIKIDSNNEALHTLEDALITQVAVLPDSFFNLDAYFSFLDQIRATERRAGELGGRAHIMEYILEREEELLEIKQISVETVSFDTLLSYASRMKRLTGLPSSSYTELKALEAKDKGDKHRFMEERVIAVLDELIKETRAKYGFSDVSPDPFYEEFKARVEELAAYLESMKRYDDAVSWLYALQKHVKKPDHVEIKDTEEMKRLQGLVEEQKKQHNPLFHKHWKKVNNEQFADRYG